MSCVLRIAGKNLDIDDFIVKSKLKGFVKRYKQETPDTGTHNEGKQYSFIASAISEAGLDDFEKQIADTIEYLRENKTKLQLIKTTNEIEYATVNFMISLKSVSDQYFAQYIYLPEELTVLCGDLKLGIEVAI